MLPDGRGYTFPVSKSKAMDFDLISPPLADPKANMRVADQVVSWTSQGYIHLALREQEQKQNSKNKKFH